MLTNVVIGPINQKDWDRLLDLKYSIQWMKKNLDKHRIYETCIDKEKQLFKKTLGKYT